MFNHEVIEKNASEWKEILSQSMQIDNRHKMLINIVDGILAMANNLDYPDLSNVGLTGYDVSSGTFQVFTAVVFRIEHYKITYVLGEDFASTLVFNIYRDAYKKPSDEFYAYLLRYLNSYTSIMRKAICFDETQLKFVGDLMYDKTNLLTPELIEQATKDALKAMIEVNAIASQLAQGIFPEPEEDPIWKIACSGTKSNTRIKPRFSFFNRTN